MGHRSLSSRLFFFSLSLSLSPSLPPPHPSLPPPTSAHRRVVLDDCAMPAIDDLVSYIRANCPHYEFEGYTGQQTSRKMKQATFIKRANDERAASRIASGKNHSSFFKLLNSRHNFIKYIYSLSQAVIGTLTLGILGADYAIEFQIIRGLLSRISSVVGLHRRILLWLQTG